jgi:LPXTG-motif cell wall-anchored protein
VKIDEDKEVETDKKKEYVLGAALPATGATTSLLVLAFALMIAGGALILSDRRKKMMKVLALGMVIIGSLAGGVAKAAPAPDGLAVTMEDPDAAVTSSNFKVGFVALDIQGRTVEIACFSNGVQYASYSLIAGGSSGDCQVNSTAMPVAGTYDFYVTATVGGEGGGTLESNHESVKLVTGAPGTPREYDRDEATCDDKISFRTDSDGGRTVKVEAYRSKNKTFTADSSTLVATLAIGSDTEGTITTTPPSCNEDYWYAIRAVDADGIGSDFVGDVDVNVTTNTSTTTITTPGEAAAGGALPANVGGAAGEGEAAGVEGAATEGQGDQEVLGETTKDESQDQIGTWNWAQNHKGSLFFLLLVLGGILYYFFYVRRTAGAGQGN